MLLGILALKATIRYSVIVLYSKHGSMDAALLHTGLLSAVLERPQCFIQRLTAKQVVHQIEHSSMHFVD